MRKEPNLKNYFAFEEIFTLISEDMLISAVQMLKI